MRRTLPRPICAMMSEMEIWPDDVAELIEDFAFLDGWEERYMHVIDLGKAMDPLPEADRTDANKVRGCASQVWLVSERDADGQLVFRGASDAHIVSGLVAIATQVFSRKPDETIRALDVDALFDALGLSEHLSTQRANGLRSMVARIKREAGATG
ncbi:MAG: SufE family protein [Litorimonas sp.]